MEIVIGIIILFAIILVLSGVKPFHKVISGLSSVLDVIHVPLLQAFNSLFHLLTVLVVVLI